MTARLDSAQVVAYVNEFYTTTDDGRRHTLDEILCQFKTQFSCEDTIAACVMMINSPSSTANVRYFGTICLYDIIRIRSNEVISNINNLEALKSFLIKTLTVGAHAQTQSVTNKLSSTLALLALYCIPDAWGEPVADLTTLWASSPELLLRVLAEMAAEFSNVTMPLAQRSVLKTELHRLSEDIRKIIWTVLTSGDTSPSTRQAAVECVEQWVRLPGVALQAWADVLSVVFAAVSEDCAALTNLLDILAANDELDNMHQLIMDICNYINMNVSQKVAQELNEDGCSEEACALVSAVCGLAEKAVPTLVQNALQASSTQLRDLVNVMRELSSFRGGYPVDERVSDLPASFFSHLREELIQTISSSKKYNVEVVRDISQSFAQLLHSAIDKLAFPVEQVFATYSKDDRDSFLDYRLARSEVAVDAYRLAGNDVLNFLNIQFGECIQQNNVNRCESVLFQWECVADYLSECDYPPIIAFLRLCTHLTLDDKIQVDSDIERRGKTLMRVLYALSHLVQEHANAFELESALLPLILSYITRVTDASEMLFALKKFIEDQSRSTEILGNSISQTCYEFFMNESRPRKDRLTAVKCIGHVLGTKPPDEAMEILCGILNAHVRDLDSLTHLDDKQLVDKYSFQIQIFSALFDSLSVKRIKRKDEEEVEPVIVRIVREAIPVFSKIVAAAPASKLVDSVCEAIRSATNALPEVYLPDIFPFVAQLLETALRTNAVSAAALAKSTVLLCGSTLADPICDAVIRWLAIFEANIGDSQFEEWLSLVYQVVKKDYKTLRKCGDKSMAIFQSSLNICVFTIANSKEPAVVRLAAMCLATIASQTTSNDDGMVRALIAQAGNALVKAIFERIQHELMRQTVESLAEVLFFFVQQFPTETRSLILGLPYGDSPMVAAMFREVGNLRNFKQMTLRLNNAASKDVNNK